MKISEDMKLLVSAIWDLNPQIVDSSTGEDARIFTFQIVYNKFYCNATRVEGADLHKIKSHAQMRYAWNKLVDIGYIVPHTKWQCKDKRQTLYTITDPRTIVRFKNLCENPSEQKREKTTKKYKFDFQLIRSDRYTERTVAFRLGGEDTPMLGLLEYSLGGFKTLKQRHSRPRRSWKIPVQREKREWRISLSYNPKVLSIYRGKNLTFKSFESMVAALEKGRFLDKSKLT